MSFNLKTYMAKTASKASLDKTTEGQLGNEGSGPETLSENQLEKSRKGEPGALSEKQLEAVRSRKNAPNELTEKQLGNKGKTPNSTSEKQLEGNRPGGSTAPVEKRLDNVRQASADKSVTTEAQLGNDGDGPSFLTESQLEGNRPGGSTEPIEKRLNSVRKATSVGSMGRSAQSAYDRSVDRAMARQRSFNRAQSAYDNMTPPEDDERPDDKKSFYVKGTEWVILSARYWEEGDEDGIHGGYKVSATNGSGSPVGDKDNVISEENLESMSHSDPSDDIDFYAKRYEKLGYVYVGDDYESAEAAVQENTPAEPEETDEEDAVTAGFNLNAYLAKRASKDKKGIPNCTTECQLGNKNDGPKDVTEKQLEGDRKEEKVATTEKLLEKARTGTPQKLTEAQMNESNSKLVQHRNAAASAGDVNKVEEQRIAAKNAQEKEKYDSASDTDQKLMLPEVKGKDGLKTASARTASSPFNGMASTFHDDLGPEIVNLFAKHGIGKNELYRFVTPGTSFKDIWTGIQAAKQGDTGALEKALDDRFGKPKSIFGSADGSVKVATGPAGGIKPSRRPRRTGLDEYGLGNFDIAVDDPFHMDDSEGFRRRELNPKDVEEFTSNFPGKSNRAIEEAALAEGASRGVKEPGAEEMAEMEDPTAGEFIDQVDEALPEEEGASEIPEMEPKFIEDSVQDVSVGVTTMRQITLSFDPSEFDNTQQAKSEAVGFILSKYPALFSYKVGNEPIEISRSLTVMPRDGKVVAMLPAAAFKAKEPKAA